MPNRSWKNVLAISLITIFTIFQTPPSLGHSGDVLSAWSITTPTIDGVISTGEWVDAAVADFTLSYCSESHDVTLYVKNDDTYLYLAAVVRDEEYSNLAEMYHDFANFYFDNNNNGVTDVGEDGIAIRFDNTVFLDTYNPNGVNGWSYSDDSNGGTNDIVGAVTHTNPVPDGVGDYTFEYRHPLNSADDSHDFSLNAGDTVGFRFSFPDGEAPCQPVGYHWPSSSPAGYADIVIASEPYLKALFVPLNWTNTQEAFDTQADTQIGFFVDAIPLSACPEKVAIAKLDVATENFSTFTCTAGGSCGVGTIQPFVMSLGIDAWDYDIIVGLTEDSPCPPTAGCSNGFYAIWSETDHDSVTAHEIGHIYGLGDEYCSNAAGSTDCRCSDGDQGGCGDTGGDGTTSGDINYLHAESAPHSCDCPADGSNDSSGAPCCNTAFWSSCTDVDYGICCRGNHNSVGGVAIMSYANAETRFPGTRGFDQHSVDHFAGIADLNCHSPEKPISKRIMDVRLSVYRNGKVEEEGIILTTGRPTKHGQRGKDYTFSVSNKSGKIIWSRSFNVHFDYNGPVYEGKDYSDIKYAKVPVHLKIPYTSAARKIALRQGKKTLYSRTLNFCNRNKRCDKTENYLTCPQDCPMNKKDGLCLKRVDGICDPDCRQGVDPDCKGKCGNRVCNTKENHANCPKDCPSGRKDGYCDKVKDGRCDPDCKKALDPDCRSACGDGKCVPISNITDYRIGENYENCRRDCPSGGKDGYCDKVRDGRCDPDCRKKKDPDCAKKR
jgi:hypothetical protein